MRYISFMLTTEQVRNKTKDVTRRLGWADLKPGDRLQACVKCMGIPKGGKIEKICVIEVVSVRREPLNRMTKELFYGIEEVKREGFSYAMPENRWAGAFVRMFSIEMNVKSDAMVTRIEFKYL